VRYYIKYVDTQYHHTTVNIGGVNPAAQPSITSGAVGLCCTAPDGDKALSVSLEPRGKSGSAYIIDFYNYWLEMKSWGDIVNPPAPANEPDPITGALKKPAAGNGFLIGSEPRFDFNRWYAVELHIKLNTPSAHDGVLGLWVDGQSVIELGPGYPKGSYTGTNFGPNAAGQPFEGLRYRDNAVLKINHIWITNYATQLSSGQTAAVYYDQLVVAKRYIGPLHP
jgi:hypothetical protein